MADIELAPSASSTRVVTAKNGDGTAFNLTGYTMRIEWVSENDPTDKGSASVSITSAASGLASYTFSASTMRLKPNVQYLVRFVADNNGTPTPLGAEGGAPLTLRVSSV